jgi:hypothetical protein
LSNILCSKIDSNAGGNSLWKDLLKYQSGSTHGSAIDHADIDGATKEGTEEHDAGGNSQLANSPADQKKFVEASAISTQPVNEGTTKILFQCDCQIITPSTNTMNPPASGTIEVTQSKVTFIRKSKAHLQPAVLNLRGQKLENSEYLWACRQFVSSHWKTDDIVDILRRNFRLRSTAVEMFLSSKKAIFINFDNQVSATLFLSTIRNVVKPPYLAPHFGVRPQNIISRATHTTASGATMTLTQAWITREISNFEYLMRLNTIAGRSFNDLGQYPVFPWIIADYVSTELKLRDPQTYRDLMWPMGAQRKEQRKLLSSKYADINYMYVKSMEGNQDMGPAVPPFHYGSHYSAAGFVMWYLLRMEPFTSLNIQLQDGKFDKPDRLFDSVEAAYRGCISNSSDVKELVPEFYFSPEIFENINRLNLGATQTGKVLGKIKLPPWAANDPHEFVRQNRNALESEYVSANLHNWIDLIFGYKQRPPYISGGNQAAVDACNIFFHLTYANAVNLDELLENDKKLYDQYVHQIAEFGQTPAQLFVDPHPRRLPLDAADINWPIASVVLGADTIIKGDPTPDKPKKIMCFKCYKISAWPVILLAETSDRIVSVDTSRVIGTHVWQALPPDVVPPYSLKVDGRALDFSQG